MDRREAVAAMMVDWGLDWESADEKADELGAVLSWYRRRGDRTRNAMHSHSVEIPGWCAKFAYVLVSSRPTVTPAEVMASLPSVAEIIEAEMVCDAIGTCGMWTHFNPFLYIAQVCEKPGSTSRRSCTLPPHSRPTSPKLARTFPPVASTLT